MNEQIFIPTETQFRKILSEVLDQELQSRIPEIIRRANRKEYITTAEFKELTGCSNRVQQYLRNEKKIPFSQEGRKIFYRSSDVDIFMDERRISLSFSDSE